MVTNNGDPTKTQGTPAAVSSRKQEILKDDDSLQIYSSSGQRIKAKGLSIRKFPERALITPTKDFSGFQNAISSTGAGQFNRPHYHTNGISPYCHSIQQDQKNSSHKTTPALPRFPSLTPLPASARILTTTASSSGDSLLSDETSSLGVSTQSGSMSSKNNLEGRSSSSVGSRTRHGGETQQSFCQPRGVQLETYSQRPLIEGANDQFRRIRYLPLGKSICDYFEFFSLIIGSIDHKKLEQSAALDVALSFLCKSNGISGHQAPPPPPSRPLLVRARERGTGVQCVAKILHKSTIPPSAGGDDIWRSLCNRLLQCDYHPNILPCYGIFEDDQYYFFFFEELQGGELFDFLLSESSVPEELCKHLMRQLLLSLEFLHDRQIVHRDVKPENLMFRYKRPASCVLPIEPKVNIVKTLPALLEPYELVLIDFDTCRMSDYTAERYKEFVQGRRRLVGTYNYMAPELLKGYDYSPASDLWSVGVILYILMTGIPPVPMGAMKSAKSSHEALKKLEAKGIDFDFPPLTDFPMARDLCIRLLKFPPKERIQSATTALNHPWLISSAALSAKYFCASPLAALFPISQHGSGGDCHYRRLIFKDAATPGGEPDVDTVNTRPRLLEYLNYPRPPVFPKTSILCIPPHPATRHYAGVIGPLVGKCAASHHTCVGGGSFLPEEDKICTPQRKRGTGRTTLSSSMNSATTAPPPDSN